jgi:hypothetical protein
MNELLTADSIRSTIKVFCIVIALFVLVNLFA